MKKIKTVLYVGAILFAVYAVINLIMNATMYASYIEYYGLGQVLPTILEGFFSYAGWAFVLLALGAICGHLAGKEEPVEAFCEPECADDEPAAEDAPVYVIEDEAAADVQVEQAEAAEVVEREAEGKAF